MLRTTAPCAAVRFVRGCRWRRRRSRPHRRPLAAPLDRPRRQLVDACASRSTPCRQAIQPREAGRPTRCGRARARQPANQSRRRVRRTPLRPTASSSGKALRGTPPPTARDSRASGREFSRSSRLVPAPSQRKRQVPLAIVSDDDAVRGVFALERNRLLAPFHPDRTRHDGRVLPAAVDLEPDESSRG